MLSKNSRVSNRARALGLPLAFGAAALSRSGIAGAQDKTTVRLTGYTSSPVEQDLFEEVLADLQTANPQIDLEYEPIPSDYFTKLQTDIAAGTVADVFYLNDLQAPDLMAPGQRLPSQQIWRKSALL